MSEFCGYNFKNDALLTQALTHASYVNEHRGAVSYQRLEFFGDAVLSMITAEYLYNTFPALSEGELSAKRSRLICKATLSARARDMELGGHIRLGKGEAKTGNALLEDVLEALIAAVYIDGGFQSAKDFIMRHILECTDISHDENYKTHLQDYSQQNGFGEPVYETVAEQGPDHDKLFTVRVLLNGKEYGGGSGHSLKAAQQEAAKSAMNALRSKNNER